VNVTVEFMSIAEVMYHHVKVAYDNFDNKRKYDDDDDDDDDDK